MTKQYKQDYKQDIINLINRGEWQHSWHLARDYYGEIDWVCSINLQRIEELIVEAEAEQRQLEAKIDRAKTALEILSATY